MRKITSLLSTIALAVACQSAPATDLFVSADGRDAWSGNLEQPNADRTDGPLASLVGARNAIRKIKASGPLPQPIRVHVRRGQYVISEPVVFEPEDSGTEQCPITYLGDPGARPTISGGRAVTGWEQQGDRWVTRLPEVAAGQWSFAALWVNGQRRTRARMPNQGYFYDE